MRRGVTLVGLALLAMAAACGTSTTTAKRSASTAAPAPDAVSTTGAPTSGPATTAIATTSSTTTAEDGFASQLPAGTQHLHFEYGPIAIAPGQNNITFSKTAVPQPSDDGYVLRITSNLRRADGSVPPVDVIHLHHGVWLNLTAKDTTITGFPERFFAVGEEKTATELPSGFGYPYHVTDKWVINYMLHNLTSSPDEVWITYDLDFLPMSAPAAATITPARPVWLDVQNGSGYPVFDVLKGTGTDGTYTYPDQAGQPYGAGPRLNEWTADHDGVLIATGGHLHPGGLYDDLVVQRGTQTVRAFRSVANYFEPAGAVPWDVAMTVTNPDWRVAVKAGDTLSVHATYDSARASWYESMGIMVVWMASTGDGADPFVTKVDTPGHLTHGHLAENDHHGGTGTELGDATTFPPRPAPAQIGIGGFLYAEGDLGIGNSLPTVKQGGTITFANLEPLDDPGIWHTITACKAPCNAETGIAYPIADGDIAFDSGELGDAGAPTAGRLTWSTPGTLPPGVYNYFCRIHPFMRGSIRVKDTKKHKGK